MSLCSPHKVSAGDRWSQWQGSQRLTSLGEWNCAAADQHALRSRMKSANEVIGLARVPVLSESSRLRSVSIYWPVHQCQMTDDGCQEVSSPLRSGDGLLKKLVHL